MTRKSRAPGSPPKYSSYGKVAKVGALWALLRQSGAQAMQIGAAVVLARLLTPYDFGIAAAVGFFLRFGNKLNSIGFGGALVRLKEVRPEHVSSVFVVSLGLSLAIWLALTLSAPALAAVFRTDEIGPALRVGALIYLLLPFGIGQMAELNREFRFKPIAIVQWTYSATFLVVSIGLALMGLGYWSLIWSQLAANAAATLMKIHFGRVQPRLRFSKAAFLEVIPFGAGLQAKRLLTFGAEYLDTLVVGRVLGLTALGLYDKAFSTVDRVVDRLAAGPGVFFRIFSVIRDDPARVRRAYERSVLGVSMLGLPTFAALIVLGPELIPVMYGEQWRASILPFQILCLAGAFRVSGAYASAVTQAQGGIWAEIARLCVYAALVLIGALLGARKGIVGVAVGIAIANGVMALLMQTLVCKLTDLEWRQVFAPQAPGLATAAMLVTSMLGADWAFSQLRPEAAEWHRLLLKVAAAGVTTLLLFLRPPLTRMRELRDEVLTDVAPGAIRYLPAWAGVPRTTPEDQRTAPRASGVVPLEEGQVSRSETSL